MIVTDSGPLIALANAGLVQAVSHMVGPLLVPQIVADECTANPSANAAHHIAGLLQSQTLRVIAASEYLGANALLSHNLHLGEAAVLAYAKHHGHAVLVDEKRAFALAGKLGVTAFRTGFLVVQLKRRGYIESVKPVLKTWGECGYFLAESTKASILEQAGE